MEEPRLKNIEEKPKEIVNLPDLKKEPQEPKKVVTKLPSWNIEPPIEINRGQK